MAFDESIESFHRGVIGTLKTLLLDEQPSSSFTSTDCGHEFEAAADHPGGVDCPECGATSIDGR